MFNYKTISCASKEGFTRMLNNESEKGWILKFYCYNEIYTGVLEREKIEQ